ncbi:hypothetical protein HanIR_Chr07g0323811 [Helianthus annuus]|nr:hypothetical protein HanIR_Chr07g0323811 [Helianthus annuus]
MNRLKPNQAMKQWQRLKMMMMMMMIMFLVGIGFSQRRFWPLRFVVPLCNALCSIWNRG